MKKSFESKIRFNIFLIILLIIVACGGIFFYFYNFQERLATQKTEVENDFTALSRTNELIYSVNEAQSIAGFYVSTKRRRYLHSFRRHIKVIDSLIHEMSVDNNYPHHNEKLQEISRLLNQQAVTIAELNKQINKQNPVQIIHEKIQSYI